MVKDIKFKEVEFKEGKLEISYYENSQDISVFENDEFTKPVSVTFIPNIEMNVQSYLKYENENIKRIIEEIKIVIAENSKFYDNFEITFNNEITGYGFSLEKLHPNGELLKVSENRISIINCKQKKAFFQ